MSLLDKIDKNNVPQHIAIIMDGNGRWALQRGLDRTEGHAKGVESVRKVVEAATVVGVEYLTVYAFSTENWLRPEEEVDALMDLMVVAIVRETEDLVKNGVSLQFIGDMQRLSSKTRGAVDEAVANTAGGEKMTLVVALSYSSRWELTHATKRIAMDVIDGVLTVEDVSEQTIEDYLETKGMPELDLLIRTGGDIRISNFLLWQAAYAELYFTDVFWPDFGAEQLYAAIVDYQKKERRFGKTSEQLED